MARFFSMFLILLLVFITSSFGEEYYGLADEPEVKPNERIVVFIEGDIDYETLDALKRIKPSKIMAIALNSPGGRLEPSYMIASYVRANGFVTYIPESAECDSGCAIIFQAGSKRVMHRQSSIYYHYVWSPKKGGAHVDNDAATLDMVKVMENYGMDSVLGQRILTEKRIRIYPVDALKYGIATDVVQ